MKINEAKEIGAVDRVKASDPPAAPPPKDRVSTQQSREAQASIESARAEASATRAGRLKDIEAKVRSGSFRPNPSQVAEEILQDAEVDAKLREILGH